MWNQTVVHLLALSLAGGIVCGALWDIFKIPRIIFGIPEAPRGKIFHVCAVFLQDVVFCLSCACVTLAVTYYGNDGNLRGVAVVGEILGFAAYRVTLGALATAAVTKLRGFALRIFKGLVTSLKKLRGKIKPPEKKISKRNKIGKHQNCKVINDKRLCERALHKGQSHSS